MALLVAVAIGVWFGRTKPTELIRCDFRPYPLIGTDRLWISNAVIEVTVQEETNLVHWTYFATVDAVRFTNALIHHWRTDGARIWVSNVTIEAGDGLDTSDFQK